MHTAMGLPCVFLRIYNFPVESPRVRHMGRKMEYRELTTDQLLALMALNYGPAKRCSDGRWRSEWKSFPAEGISEVDIGSLWRAGLIEWTGSVAVATETGRLILKEGEWLRPFDATPARSGTQSPHMSLQ